MRECNSRESQDVSGFSRDASRLDSGQCIRLRIELSRRVVDHRAAEGALREFLAPRVLERIKRFVLVPANDLVDDAVAILVVEVVNLTLVRTRVGDVPLTVQICVVSARHQ